MTAAVYDAGALVAAERSDRVMWARHRVLLESGVAPAVPAPALAQVIRSPRQVQLRRLLRGCEVVAFEEQDAHAAGLLLAASVTSDVVDAAVVLVAVARRAAVLTSDRADVTTLSAAAGTRLPIIDV